MARSDLIKRLLASYRRRDYSEFEEVASEIIEEERKKQHPVLANELERIMHSNRDVRDTRKTQNYEPPPSNSESDASLIEIREPNRYLDDLVLDEKTRNVVERMMYEFREWEVLEANGLHPVHRILFCGPSGCGKTATAESVATQLSLPLLYVRFDAVVSSLLGETAANLRKVFDFASRGQWVILFDEFDAIGRSRDDSTEHGEIKRVVNSLLQLMDSFRGRSLLIAATNYEKSLDSAIWRRFDEVIRFGMPTVDQIRELVERKLEPVRVDRQQIRSVASALTDATFAEAERVCLDIRKSCALRGMRQVSNEDIEQALSRFDYRRSVIDNLSSD